MKYKADYPFLHEGGACHYDAESRIRGTDSIACPTATRAGAEKRSKPHAERSTIPRWMGTKWSDETRMLHGCLGSIAEKRKMGWTEACQLTGARDHDKADEASSNKA